METCLGIFRKRVGDLINSGEAVEITWLRNLRLALPFAVLAFALGAAFNTQLSAGETRGLIFDAVAYPLLAVGLAGLWAVLMVWPRSATAVNNAIVGASGVFFATKLAWALFWGPPGQTLGELSETFYWLPALYVLTSLVHSNLTRMLTTGTFLAIVGLGASYLLLGTGGEERPRVLFALSQLCLSNVVLYALTYNTARAERRHKDEMRRIAVTDTLTGLQNRLGLTNRLGQTLREAHANDERFALLFLDLDGFKLVNDTFDHETGDLLLKEVARRLKALDRQFDTIARLGGDEFVIIARKVSHGHAETLAQRVHETISRPYAMTGGLPVGASIGLSEFPADGLNAADLLKVADTRMYNVKKQRKARKEVAA